MYNTLNKYFNASSDDRGIRLTKQNNLTHRKVYHPTKSCLYHFCDLEEINGDKLKLRQTKQNNFNISTAICLSSLRRTTGNELLKKNSQYFHSLSSLKISRKYIPPSRRNLADKKGKQRRRKKAKKKYNHYKVLRSIGTN